MKKLVLSALSRLASSRRYALLPEWHLQDLAMANHLRTLFGLYGVDVVLDVGANRGQYRDFLRERVGFSGRIHSFEPLSHLRDLLRERSSGDPTWEIHGCALGADDTTLELQIAARDSFSSFCTLDSDIPESFRASARVQAKERVPVHRLDSLASQLAGVANGNVYLKVDTQGFDMEVLKGAGALLRGFAGLQFELAVRRIYQGVPDYCEALRFVESLGFDLSAVFPITTDDALRAVEFDCIMVGRAGSAALLNKVQA